MGEDDVCLDLNLPKVLNSCELPKKKKRTYSSIKLVVRFMR